MSEKIRRAFLLTPIELANPYRGESGKNSVEESRFIERPKVIYSYALRDFFTQLMCLENSGLLKTQSNRERPNKRRKAV